MLYISTWWDLAIVQLSFVLLCTSSVLTIKGNIVCDKSEEEWRIDNCAKVSRFENYSNRWMSFLKVV